MKQPFPAEEQAKVCPYAYFDSYFSEVICTNKSEPCRIAIWNCPKDKEELK